MRSIKIPRVRGVGRGWVERTQVGGPEGEDPGLSGSPASSLPCTDLSLLAFAEVSGWGLHIGSCYHHLPGLLITCVGNFCHQLYTMIEQS